MRSYRERTEDIRQKLKRKKRARRAAIGGCTGALGALSLFALILFVPYTTGGAPNLFQYRESEYYPVIERIAELSSDDVVYESNFDRWGIRDLFGAKGETVAVPDSPAVNETEGAGGYREVTDLQTEGVIEGDLFKRSEHYLFYLSCRMEQRSLDGQTFKSAYARDLVPRIGLSLGVYSVAQEESRLLSELALPAAEGFVFGSDSKEREMYLSEDCSAVTVIVPCYETATGLKYTAIYRVDVSDPYTMSADRPLFLSGDYVTSRMKDGRLLLVDNFAVYRPDFDEERSFLPAFGYAGEMEILPFGNIYLPEHSTRACYTVLACVGEDGLLSAEALFSFSQEVYVSQDSLFATNAYTGEEGVVCTEIARVLYGDGFVLGGKAVIEGTVHDRYSMDAYDGYLRVFADAPADFRKGLQENVSLFIFEEDTMELVSSVERFAPDGETVQSARFDKNYGYVCTALIVKFTDPVYYFDLSDPTHVSNKDTGTISGYSAFLTKFSRGTLLGIGYENDREFKLELYGETETAVESVAVFARDAYNVPSDYKAFFIDREHGLIGAAACFFDEEEQIFRNEYLLFLFDGYGIDVVCRLEMEGEPSDARAFYADGCFYMVSEKDFYAVPLGL